MAIIGAAFGDKILCDCAIGTINEVTNDVSPCDYYHKLMDYKFLRLLPGKNQITVGGYISEITFTWQNERWII